MLHLESFSFNPFQENTYVIYNDNKECWIVDPGMYEPAEFRQFNDFIAINNLMPKAIINTHTHLDHIFGVDALKSKYQVPFYIHEKELPVLKGATASAALFGFDFQNPPVHDYFVDNAKPLQLSADSLEVRLAPGHSPGSIVFYYPEGKWLIGGDVLFHGSIGRTDLPGGDFDTLIESIKTQLYTLPDDTIVYSGHGTVTSIGQEKQHNPFVRG